MAYTLESNPNVVFQSCQLSRGSPRKINIYIQECVELPEKALLCSKYSHIGQYNYLQVSTKSLIWDNEFHDICVLILRYKSNQRGTY